MRKKKNAFFSFLKGTIVPFLTVFVIVIISLWIYNKISEVAAGNDTLIYIVMILAVFAMAVAFVVADKIQRKITTENPVKEILDATEKIAAGDFSIRLNTIHAYDKYNDFDLIKENLNAMVAELEKSEILKTDFISNVSHELKTPLAVIQSYITLLQGDLDKETKQQYIQIVVSATKRLTDLVTNVLKLNKLEHQQLNLEKKQIRLDDMLAETVLHFEELIDKKNLEIQCHLEEVEIYSSASSLEIVFNNLLSNAVKFTDEGGKITVKLTKEMGDAIVEIGDTGCGISAETGAHIFDKFYQGDTSHAQEGNGLGLALVKKVIDVIGGEISVSSELGKGSTFRVVLKEDK